MEVWGVNSFGGNLATPSIDYTIRQRATNTTVFHQSTSTVSSFGKHKADRVLLDKLGRLVTPMSTSGIAESDPTPETSFPIVQTSVIVGEYANSVSWTERLDTFSSFPVGQLVGQVLRQDQIEGLDKVAYAAYGGCKVIYVPLTSTTGQFTTNGTPGAAAGSVATPFHVRDITDYLRSQLKAPPLVGGDYLCICHTDFARGIKDSSEFLEVSKYAQPEKIYRSEVGKLGGARFFEENNATASPVGTNTVGLGEAFVIGADNVVEAVAQAPHLRFGIPVDFGRDRREGHFYYGGFARVWDFATDGEEHAVHVSST